GQARWLSASAINSEASGYFLAPGDKIPSEWRKLRLDETDQIFGKGAPNHIDDFPDESCSDTCCPPDYGGGSGGGGPAGGGGFGGCKGGCGGGVAPPVKVLAEFGGMPYWWVSEPYMNLWIQDEPLGYEPARGTRISFRLNF